MGKTNFVFDKESGTMKPLMESTPTQIQVPENVAPQVIEQPKEMFEDIEFEEPIVKDGKIQFRYQLDQKVINFIDERTGNPMMIIAGYGLEMKFNIQELKSVAKIEGFLDELKAFFRKHLMDQIMDQVNQ